MIERRTRTESRDWDYWDEVPASHDPLADRILDAGEWLEIHRCDGLVVQYRKVGGRS